jgi:hypothetical protein
VVLYLAPAGSTLDSYRVVYGWDDKASDEPGNQAIPVVARQVEATRRQGRCVFAWSCVFIRFLPHHVCLVLRIFDALKYKCSVWLCFTHYFRSRYGDAITIIRWIGCRVRIRPKNDSDNKKLGTDCSTVGGGSDVGVRYRRYSDLLDNTHLIGGFGE